MNPLDKIKVQEERKRDAAYDPVARWKHIQETITWAEANLPPEKRRNRPRQPAQLHRNTGRNDSLRFD
jgi:hypothetical protein